MRALRDLKKLRMAEDEPDAPTYIRDRTPLKKGQITTLALRDEFRKDPALPILIGDDIFVRAIRRGIEQREYVYRRGELLFGPGDPAASIVIDEQSVVFTMAYASEHGIWPRPIAPKPEETPRQPGGYPEPPATPGGNLGEAPPAGAFTAEGILKEALIKLWEQARAKKVEKIGVLSVRLFDASDAFKLLGAIGAVPGATKQVTLSGGYETTSGGTMEMSFTGPVADAQPVKEFIEPQLRAAKDKTLQAAFRLTFDDGLAMVGDAAEKFTERLSRFASGAAYVSATAEVKP